MKIMDLTEAPEYSSLIAQANRGIEETVRKFINDQLNEWRREAIRRRREKLGYHPYKDIAPGYKNYDEDEMDAANKDWGVDSDGVGDALDEFIPNIEKSNGRSPVYALMSAVSKTLTKLTQDYIRSKYGDTITIAKSKKYPDSFVERAVNNIRVLIWWTKNSNTKGDYRGIYRSSSHNINVNSNDKLETLIEIIVDRQVWSDMIRNEVGALLGGDGLQLDDFSHQIMNTYIHELAHLEQDIKGYKGKLRLIPGKKKNVSGPNKTSRANTFDWEDEFERYLSSTAEIDAHSSGAAAEVVNRIINQHARYGSRWNDKWTPNDIENSEWNSAIKDAISGVAYGEIPKSEYAKYIESLDRRYKDIPDETIKDKFLKKVRQKFIKSYVNRLNAYLRPNNK